MADVSMVTSNADHVDMLWKGLIGCSTLLVGVFGIMYHRINRDIEGESKARIKSCDEVQAKLDRGISSFALMGEQLVKIGEQIKSLENKDAESTKDLETHNIEAKKIIMAIQTDIKELSKSLLIITVEHEHCMAQQEKVNI